MNISLLDLIIGVAAFGTVAALWIGFVLVLAARRGARERQLAQRLGLVPPDGPTRVLRLWHEGKEQTTVVQGRSLKQGLRARLDRFMLDARLSVPLTTVLLALVGGAALLAAVVLAITGSLLIAGVTVGGFLIICWLCIKRRMSRGVAVFETQFVDALELAARSLRAGHPLLGAFRLIADEMAPPMSSTFARVCQQQAMGISMEQALREVAAQSTSEDMKFFATSVAIQLRSGGNLADMMERLAYVIRDRMRLYRRVRTITAQTQFSKRVLIALPFLLFVTLNLVNPGYMKPLYLTPDGRILLGAAGIGMLAGIWAMNRLAVIHW